VLPLDLGMLYWCLELLVLRACASLCASFVVIPTRPSATPQELQEWRWLSDAATAAAVAAAEQVESSSFRQAAHVVRLAARAAAAATGTSGQGAVGQGQAPESQGASSVRERGRRGVGRASGGTRGGVGVPRGEGGCPRSSARPTLRWSLTLGDKFVLIDVKDAGHSLSQTLTMFLPNVSLAAEPTVRKRLGCSTGTSLVGGTCRPTKDDMLAEPEP